MIDTHRGQAKKEAENIPAKLPKEPERKREESISIYQYWT
jgi:hypothetical protein